MTETNMKEITFQRWGCTDGVTTCSCKTCKLTTPLECVVFQDCTKFVQLYAIKGEF